MKFKVGDRVEDEVFGKGTVVEINSGDEKKCVLVKFDKKNSSLHSATVSSLKGPYEENSCWFYNKVEQEKLKLIKEYTYEDLKKSQIGTKLTFENGEVLIKNSNDRYENKKYWRNEDDLKRLKDKIETLGKIIKIEEPEYKTVYEAKLEILDEVEKRYLRGVIRPFEVRFIKKVDLTNAEYIYIELKSDHISLPNFSSNTMYKGMEIDKKYTLEELGL